MIVNVVAFWLGGGGLGAGGQKVASVREREEEVTKSATWPLLPLLAYLNILTKLVRSSRRGSGGGGKPEQQQCGAPPATMNGG